MAVMRVPIWKDATRSADASAYTRRVEVDHRLGRIQKRWMARTISNTETEFSPPMATRSGASALSLARTT